MELYETRTASIQGNRSLVFFVGMLGICMNQSNVMFGFNLSLADFMTVIIVLLLLVNTIFDLPTKILTCFLFFSFFLLINSTIVIPAIYNMPIGTTFLLKDYFKLVVSLLYFCIGSHIAKLGLTEVLLKWFLVFATITGFIGILIFFIRIPILSETMLFAETRLIGFMNDPNYFAVIQCSALAVILRIKIRLPWLKIFGITILLLSILGSGSKTGIITLACFLLLRIFHLITEGKLNGVNLLYTLLLLLLVVIFSPVISTAFVSTMNVITERFPIFYRVQLLVTDFNSAISEGGSSRNIQWGIGLELIKNHPISGVGIGQNYLWLASKITREANIAHNTYIQMAAEWGIPVTSILFISIGKAFFTPAADKNERQLIWTVKEMFFTFLVSSMALSFNYSRIFWLLLGMLAFYSLPVKKVERKR